VVYREWPRRYLQYFLALGAGYMLSVAFVEVIPEVDTPGGEQALLFVLIGFFLVHLFEHTIAPHFHFGEETHMEEMQHHHARSTVLLGLAIHTFFDGVAIAAGFLVSTWLGMVIFWRCSFTSCRKDSPWLPLCSPAARVSAARCKPPGLLGAATLAGVLLTSQLQGQLKYALPLSGE